MVFLVCGFLNVHGKSTIKATDTRFLPEASSMSLFRPKIKKMLCFQLPDRQSKKCADCNFFFAHKQKKINLQPTP